ncbi:MAG: alpha-amylase family glycosyl hydrolase, partial [Cytophagales bacterium]|nr:alpha-amylase family glycosyl hydrolase [Cytophagales bacterium]
PHLFTPVAGRDDGSKAYLKDLVDAFHREDIKIILDMVVNHTGYHTGSYQNYPDKFFDDSHFNRGEGTVEGELAGLPDLDHDQIDVADYFIQNILSWIEGTGIDGIRMDTVKHVEDTFWYLFKSQIKTRHSNVTVVGEVLDWDAEYISRYQRDHDFDSIFDFPLCGVMKGCFIRDRPMTDLARPRLHANESKGILDIDKVYTNANRLVTLLDNHDLDKRIMSEILDHTGHWDKDLAREILKLSLTFLMTSRGIPQLYYGTEIGMTGYRDPDNRKDMPWSVFDANDMPVNAFEKEIFEHTIKIISIRKDNPAIAFGYLITLYVDTFIYAYLREFQDNVVIVVVNNGKKSMPVPLTIHLHGNTNIPARVKDLLADGTKLKSQFPSLEDIEIISGDFKVILPGKTAGVYCFQKN